MIVPRMKHGISNIISTVSDTPNIVHLNFAPLQTVTKIVWCLLFFDYPNKMISVPPHLLYLTPVFESDLKGVDMPRLKIKAPNTFIMKADNYLSRVRQLQGRYGWHIKEKLPRP
jgi:hypothetical protein